MDRRSALAAAAAAAAAVLVLAAPPGGTSASWRVQSTVTPGTATADTLGLTVSDSTNTVDQTQATPTDLANEPALTLVSTASRLQGWIDVVSTRVTVPASNTGSTLLSKVDVDYAVSPTGCLTGLADPPYWNVNGTGAGGLTAGTTYSRSSTPVTGANLAANATTRVCPWVRPSYDTTTASGRSQFLREQAGRQLDLQTVVRLRQPSPGTWSSPTSTLTTRYQVKAPPATRPGDGVVCRRTGLFGNPDSVLGTYGKLYWAWPFTADSSSTTTPAVDRFVLLRSTDGVSWAPFRQSATQSTTAPLYQYAGSARASDNINSSDLANNAATPVWLSVRAYLYANNDTVYVDADWMVQVSEGYSSLDDYFACRGGSGESNTSGVANPAAGPRGL